MEAEIVHDEAIAHLQLLDRALRGEAAALSQLVALLLPVIRSRVARVLIRHPGAQARDTAPDVEDLTQEAITALFAGQGAALRRWEPRRGLALRSYVGMLAEQRALQVLRSRRRSPWTDTPTDVDELAPMPSPEPGPERSVGASHELDRVLDRLRARLSPKALLVFELSIVEERTLDEVCVATGMSVDAVHQWRTRIRRTCAEVAAELAAAGGPP